MDVSTESAFGGSCVLTDDMDDMFRFTFRNRAVRADLLLSQRGRRQGTGTALTELPSPFSPVTLENKHHLPEINVSLYATRKGGGNEAARADNSHQGPVIKHNHTMELK